MILKLLLFIFISISLGAKEVLYLNYPSNSPSSQTKTHFGKELINLINDTKTEIHFAIYGLRKQDEVLQALIQATKRGIKVYGVVDSDTHGDNYYSDTQELSKYFKIVSDHKSHIMHNKFFILDRQIVWTGSSNISDTGTGGYNANNVLVVNNSAIANEYLKEFMQMHTNKNFGKSKSPHSTFTKTETSEIALYFSPKSNTYKSGIEKLIENARSYIYIPIFYLTHKELSSKLIDAHNRGVDIKIILDASAANNKYSMHKALRNNGIAIKVENFGGKMHMKSLIIDDTYFISGSMNFTKAGVISNDENTIIVKNHKLAKEYKDFFLTLWREIPDKYSKFDPKAESSESKNSCYDGVDNDFDKGVDKYDKSCG